MQKEKLAKVLGQRITQLRKERGMSQVDLAAEISKDKQALTRIEGGKINITVYTASIVADALGVTLSELFDVEALNRKGK